MSANMLRLINNSLTLGLLGLFMYLGFVVVNMFSNYLFQI
jgi:hypothetical protein